MKQLVAIFSVFSFVAVLGISSAMSQLVTGCFNDNKKDSKIGRVSSGSEPGKPCKDKQTQVSLATDLLTDDLQDQIDDLEADILFLDEDLQGQIDDNAAKGQENMDRLDAIATVIGGSSGVNDLPTIDETRYMGMFVGRLRTSDRNVENRLPVAGTLTNFWVRQGGPDPLTGDATRVFTVLLRARPAEPVATALTCTLELPDNEFACADDLHCVDVMANRRITVEIDNNPNTGTLGAVETNWSAKFTPGAICPVL